MNKRNQNKPEAETGFAVYFWVRVMVGLVIAVVLIWGSTQAVNYLGQSRNVHEDLTLSTAPDHTTAEKSGSQDEAAAHGTAETAEEQVSVDQETDVQQGMEEKAVTGNQAVHSKPKAKAVQHGVAVHGEEQSQTEATGHSGPSSAKQVKGVAFVDAMIKPVEYELKERMWGWRPNDLVQFTDNVNNFQLGLLEATRRATRMLAERISRTGTTNILDKNLERAMNCFMIDPDSYWLPSAEAKYEEGLEELRTYKQRLIEGDADFYTRADNLIPLLVAFSDLVGSCDDNLVKATEKTGKPVSTFAADNYFYYAKGVASAILPILEAVAVDYEETLITRRAMDVLLHAIHACHEAANLEPWIVLESDMDGIFANHRANLAAYISHVRFYLDVLAATLST